VAVWETETSAPGSSDLYIVTKYDYSADMGRLTGTFDNNDRETRREYDALGRTTAVIENYSDGLPPKRTTRQNSNDI